MITGLISTSYVDSDGRNTNLKLEPRHERTRAEISQA